MSEKNFEVIKQLKSWLAVNLFVGCPSGCGYCYRHNDGMFSLREPVQIQTEEEALKELLGHRFFLPDSTPIAIHNIATDPFFEEPKKATFGILEKLDNLGFANSAGLVTKQLVTMDDISFLESLSHTDVNILVTYSEMPGTIEPIGHKKRKQSLENLSDSKIKVILYWRPIIRDQNTDEKRIEAILELGEEYADAFVVSGLRASPKILAYLENRGIHLEGEFDPDHKYLPEDILEKILESYVRKGISTPLFRRTSCAVSHLKNISDYNAHWSNPRKNCLELCPQSQRQRCNSVPKPDREGVEFLLRRLGYDSDTEFEIHEKYLGIRSKLTREEMTYLRHNLHFPLTLT